MILLPVDEAYAFDFLAILQIKRQKNLLDVDTYTDIVNTIEEQIGAQNFKKILKSAEYKKLLQANKKTFHSVDLARQNKISAHDLDRCNYNRFLAKKELQTKFFKNNLFEVKKYKHE